MYLNIYFILYENRLSVGL